jgi:hypothetical protein
MMVRGLVGLPVLLVGGDRVRRPADSVDIQASLPAPPADTARAVSSFADVARYPVPTADRSLS